MCLSTLTSRFSIWLSRQRWLPYKTRRSIIKRLHPAMLKDYAFETEFYGLTFRGNIVNYIDRLVYFDGGHERYMLTLLKNYAEGMKREGAPAFAFADVGANAGNHTLFMSQHVEGVYAFEPFERVRLQMQNNLSANNIRNVQVFDFGLSNENASLPFYAGPDANLGAASFQAAHKQDNYYLGNMQLKRGDEVMAGQSLPIGILKADVEGFEKFVLEGLTETLKKDRPLIVIELSPTTRETLGSQEALHALFPEGYVFYYFAKASNRAGSYTLAPFNYGLMPKIQDVIACPKEKLGFLPISSL